MQSTIIQEEMRGDLAALLRRKLLLLARAEEDRAASQAASIPYWSPCPPSVQGHRLAAEVLRAEADTLAV